MKKLWICVLSILFASIPMASAGIVPARPFTTEVTVDTSTNLYISAYYGLWSMDVEVNDNVRNMCVYVPQNYFPCCDMLLVLAPDGKSAEEFANESGWMPLAEKYGFGIPFFEADEGMWNLKDP